MVVICNSDTESSIEMMAISLNTQLKNLPADSFVMSPKSSTEIFKDEKAIIKEHFIECYLCVSLIEIYFTALSTFWE